MTGHREAEREQAFREFREALAPLERSGKMRGVLLQYHPRVKKHGRRSTSSWRRATSSTRSCRSSSPTAPGWSRSEQADTLAFLEKHSLAYSPSTHRGRVPPTSFRRSPPDEWLRRSTERRWRHASAVRRRRRTQGCASRETRACPPARPAPARSGGGTRRAARSGSRRSRAATSSSSACRVCPTRGWYWRRTPRIFPDRSSGASASRNSRKACSRSASRCPVISPDAFTWKVKSAGVRSAHFCAVSGDGSA